MYIPRVLSPKALISLDPNSLSSLASLSSVHTPTRLGIRQKSPEHDYHPSTFCSSQFQEYFPKISSQTSLFPKVSQNTVTSISHMNSNSSKVSHLLKEINALEERSESFSSSFERVTVKLQHYSQSQSLKLNILNNQISELKIDLKQREQDIKLLIEMVGSKDKISSIADKSTDTEGSSSGKSSCSTNGKPSIMSARSMKSARSGRSENKRMLSKQGVKIFSKI